MPGVLILIVLAAATGLAYQAAAGANLTSLERVGMVLVALAGATLVVPVAAAGSMATGWFLPLSVILLTAGALLDAIGLANRFRARWRRQ